MKRGINGRYMRIAKGSVGREWGPEIRRTSEGPEKEIHRVISYRYRSILQGSKFVVGDRLARVD